MTWTPLFSEVLPLGDKVVTVEAFADGANRGLRLNGYPSRPIPFAPNRPNDDGSVLLVELLPSKLGLSQEEAAELQRSLLKTEFLEKLKAPSQAAGLGHRQLADMLMSQYILVTLQDTNEIMFYAEGVYHAGAEAKVGAYLEQIKPDIKKNDVEEVLGHIRRLTYCQREDFDADRFILNVRNGLFDVRGFKLVPHTPGYLSLVQLPMSYDATKECTEVRKFMSEVMFEDDIKIAQEWFGFCLWREYTTKKALLLVGEGNNGKSVWLDVLRVFLGQENVAARSLQELELNRFAKVDLYLRMACIFADLPDLALEHTGTFKMLTGRDLLTGEKKFKNAFTFENYAKLCFSCNKIPETKDDTDAFFLRWLILVFPNTFSGDTDRKRMLEKLTTPDELSGLLKWAIEGLKRLQEQNWAFSNSRSTTDLRKEYTRRSSPILSFKEDCLAEDVDAHVRKETLFATFSEYCRDHKLPNPGKDAFFKRLPEHVNITTSRKGSEGKRYWAFLGIDLRDKKDWGTGISEVDDT